VTGLVGDGPANEYLGFREYYQELPDFNQIVLDPEGTPLPEKPGARFACIAMLANRSTKGAMHQVATYVAKFRSQLQMPELEVLFYRDIMRRKPECRHTKEFSEWARVHGAQVLL
jgi:hypothetical protein